MCVTKKDVLNILHDMLNDFHEDSCQDKFKYFRLIKDEKGTHIYFYCEDHRESSVRIEMFTSDGITSVCENILELGTRYCFNNNELTIYKE